MIYIMMYYKAECIFIWSRQTYLFYDFNICYYVQFNIIAYSNEFYKPMKLEAFQTQAFTFLFRIMSWG